MRIDVSQVLGQGGFRIKGGAAAFTDSLKEGDVVKARVLSSERGSIVMKTEGGQTLRAKLGAEAALMPGDEIQLEVSGKDKGLVLLSVSREEAVIGESAGKTGRVWVPVDKSLEPYLDKLTELKMPVTVESARQMQALMAENPGMTLEEAAFLVTNKMTADESIMKAALALLSGGEKTDALIAKLLDFLKLPGLADSAPGPHQAGAAQEAGGFQGSGASGQTPVDGSAQNPPFVGHQPSAPLSDKAAPLTDLLSLLEGRFADAAEAGVGKAPIVAPNAQTIITQSDSIMQSTNVEKLQENILNSVKTAEYAGLEQQNLENRGTVVEFKGQGLEAQSTNHKAQITNMDEVRETGIRSQESLIRDQGLEIMGKGPGGGRAFGINAQLSALLSEIPEFRGTPAPALERFSNMLLRVAGEFAEASGSDGEKLEALLDKLFTRVGKGDSNAGERLRTAREELFTRLTLIEETIARATPHAKAEMMEQTQRLMEHVRVLNSIDQFVYMQLPVQMGQERKAAELYVFKRKGGKRADPENVNILMALDLENMGRWEGLINIRGKDVSVQMEVKGAAEKAHFSENTVLLHEMLAQAGFKLVNTGITFSEGETLPPTALVSLDRYTSGRVGAIDFKI